VNAGRLRALNYEVICIEGYKFIHFEDTFPNMMVVQLLEIDGRPARCQ